MIVLHEDASRAARLFVMDPAAWPRRDRRTRRSASRDAILAAFDPTLTIKEIADKTGTRYGTTAMLLLRAGLKAKRGHHTIVDPADIIAAAKAGPNLAAVALKFSISLERVRQIVKRHETETGELIPRQRRDHANHPLRRVDQACSSGCGRTRSTTPSAPPWRCPNCGPPGSVTIEAIIDIAERRIAGAEWQDLAEYAGYSRKLTHPLKRMVWSRLNRAGRGDLVALLWPKGTPHWLKRHERAPR